MGKPVWQGERRKNLEDGGVSRPTRFPARVRQRRMAQEAGPVIIQRRESEGRDQVRSPFARVNSPTGLITTARYAKRLRAHQFQTSLQRMRVSIFLSRPTQPGRPRGVGGRRSASGQGLGQLRGCAAFGASRLPEPFQSMTLRRKKRGSRPARGANELAVRPDREGWREEPVLARG